jgi:hypothetical protein
MKLLARRIAAVEAKPLPAMSEAEKGIRRARMAAELKLLAHGRELPACCDRPIPDTSTWPYRLRASRERLLAELDREIAAGEEAPEFVAFLPAAELDALDQFLIEVGNNGRT